MLKLPPPIWALFYVLTAAAISWLFGWSKVPGFPLVSLGISLVAISWILPVWAIVLFRREGTEVEPTSATNRKLITRGPYHGEYRKAARVAASRVILVPVPMSAFDPKRTFMVRNVTRAAWPMPKACSLSLRWGRALSSGKMYARFNAILS